MKKLLSVFALLFSLFILNKASAQDLTQLVTDSVVTYGNPLLPINLKVPKFDSNNGTLVSVDVKFTVSNLGLNNMFQYENTGHSIDSNVNLKGYLTYGATISPLVSGSASVGVNNIRVNNFQGIVPAFDGTLDFQGPSSVNNPDSTFNVSYDFAGLPSGFNGSISDSVNVIYIDSFSTISSVTGGGNNISFYSVAYKLELQVTYTYRQNSVLPVDLVKFDAVYNAKEQNVAIDWASASENSLDYYEIEYSTNSKDFASLNSIPAKNENSGTAVYNYVHQIGSPINIDAYYRLKMVNDNGTYKYSNIRHVTINTTNYNAMTLYPNPAHGGINIKGNNLVSGKYEIVNTQGRVVYSTVLARGQQLFNIDISSLTKGNYILISASGDKQMFTAN